MVITAVGAVYYYIVIILVHYLNPYLPVKFIIKTHTTYVVSAFIIDNRLLVIYWFLLLQYILDT